MQGMQLRVLTKSSDTLTQLTGLTENTRGPTLDCSTPESKGSKANHPA